MIMHFQLMNPIWPDAQPYDTWLLLAVACGIVWYHKNLLLDRTGAVDQILPGKELPMRKRKASVLAT
jgi:hypothetical protein